MAGASYAIQLKPAAERDLKRVKDRAVLRRVVRAIDLLGTNPRLPHVKTLQGDDSMLRIRVGDYRLLYTIENGALLIIVIRIGHRREVNRGR